MASDGELAPSMQRQGRKKSPAQAFAHAELGLYMMSLITLVRGECAEAQPLPTKGQRGEAQRSGGTHGFMSKQMLSSGWAPKERNMMAMKDTPKKLRASEGTGCWLLNSEPTMSPTTATCTCRTSHEPLVLQPLPASATCISTASTDAARNSQARWRQTQSPWFWRQRRKAELAQTWMTRPRTRPASRTVSFHCRSISTCTASHQDSAYGR